LESIIEFWLFKSDTMHALNYAKQLRSSIEQPTTKQPTKQPTKNQSRTKQEPTMNQSRAKQEPTYQLSRTIIYFTVHCLSTFCFSYRM